jgi:hypothetical protein
LDLCVGEARQGRERLRAVLIVAADTGLLEMNCSYWIPQIWISSGVITIRAINAKSNPSRQIPMTRRVYEGLKKLCEKNSQK